MIKEGIRICPECGGQLVYYDRVRRMVKGKYGEKTFIFLNRYKCRECGICHREIPRLVFPYKHYESEIIVGVLHGFIFSDTLGFEDYPCELTMKRWRAIYTSPITKRISTI